MVVFVTGGTGVLGRPTIRRLVAASHTVRGLARSDSNERLLELLGAEPMRASLFDPAAMRGAVRDAEAVLHLATNIPSFRDAPRERAWRQNDRIRTEGTRNLVDAALTTGTTTFVYPSVCLVYPDRGSQWIDADATEPGELPPVLRSTVAAESEVARFSASGGRGIVLRMGAFYAPDAGSTLDMLGLARPGLAPFIGCKDAFVSHIWVDDASAAVAAALERAPAGVYDVVDDEPLGRGELVGLVARAVGRRRLLVPPTLLIRLTAGRKALFVARSQRVSNRRFKPATGWAPMVPSAREGWARIAAHCRAPIGTQSQE